MHRKIALSTAAAFLLLVGCGDDDDKSDKTSLHSVDVVLNELKANTPEDLHKYQFIELRGTPNESLQDHHLLILDGDEGEAGRIDYALDLSGITIGENGLVLVKSPDVTYVMADTATTIYNDARIRTYDPDVDGDAHEDGIIEHDSITFMIVRSGSAFSDGDDLDGDDDGVLELPNDATVVDSVGWIYDDGGIIYASDTLTQSASGPDAATRFYDDLSVNTLAAWANGDILEDTDIDDDEELAAELRYDPSQASSNLPPNARLTPGNHNFRAAPFVLLNEAVFSGDSRFIELLSNAVQSMDGLYVVAVDGSGKAVTSINLSGVRAKEDGLTLLQPTSSSVPVDLSDLENAHTLLLIYSPDASISVGQTLDSHGDGNLELSETAQVVDGISWSGGSDATLYADVAFMTGYQVDALSRYKDNRAVASSSWTYGVLNGTNYDASASKNVPENAMVTPGGVNIAEFTSMLVYPVLETARTTVGGADADDIAFWIHPGDPSQSLIIATQKEAGYSIYDVDGNTLEDRLPGEIRYNNVDVIYDMSVGGENIDVALFSDRKYNKFIIYRINQSAPYLTDITDYGSMELFDAEEEGEDTAYGEAVFKSPKTGKIYACATQNSTNLVRQFELVDNDGKVGWNLVRTITLGAGDDDEHAEGMVVDQEYGVLYISQEPVGLYRVNAEPDGGDVVLGEDDFVVEEGDHNVAEDLEGLTIYYGDDGEGYLFLSSQGNYTYAVFDRQTNDYIKSFVIANDANGIDGAQETDSLDVTNIALSTQFAHGAFIVQDGMDTTSDPDDTETNFKWIRWEDIATGLEASSVDSSYDPRNPVQRY